MKFNLKEFRKWCRFIHRDLSYFFAGLILIYAISGIVMNHRDTINPHFNLSTYRYTLPEAIPSQDKITKDFVLKLLEKHHEEGNYTKHYFPEAGMMKVFLKGGSNYHLNINTGDVLYESVKRRPIIGAMTKLHYNPGQWWTLFADAFAIALIVITATGMFLVRGNKGLWGRGGIEFVLGLLIPLAFLLFF